MSRYYTPGDPNSSPYDPAMGDIVVYRQTSRESFPAIVVRAFENDRVDLTVFSTTGVRYVMGVPYSGTDTAAHTWGWLPEKTPRPIQAAEVANSVS